MGMGMWMWMYGMSPASTVLNDLHVRRHVRLHERFSPRKLPLAFRRAELACRALPVRAVLGQGCEPLLAL